MLEKPRRKHCVSSLVLGILGLVFSFILPAAAYGVSIPGLALGLSKKKKKNYNSGAGIVLNIIAIIFAGINSTMGVIMTIRMYASSSKDRKSLEI